MKNETIYSLWSSVGYRSVAIDAPQSLHSLRDLNKRRLSDEWTAIGVRSLDVGDIGALLPGICVLNTGALAVANSDLARVFDGLPIEVEYLPLEVDGQSWSIVNCLSDVDGVVDQESNVMRAGNGEIFMVLRLVLGAQAISVPPLFTLTNSNRAQIFATSEFVNRIVESGVRGLQFDEIGKVCG